MEELVGFQLPGRKKEAFLHLWRVIGFLFGIEDKLNPNTSEAHATLVQESLYSNGIKAYPDPEISGVLVKHICESVAAGVRNEYGAPLTPGLMAVPAWSFLGEA